MHVKVGSFHLCITSCQSRPCCEFLLVSVGSVSIAVPVVARTCCSRGMSTRACKVVLKPAVCSKKTLVFVHLEGAWVQCLSPQTKPPGHPTGSLAGRAWRPRASEHKSLATPQSDITQKRTRTQTHYIKWGKGGSQSEAFFLCNAFSANRRDRPSHLQSLEPRGLYPPVPNKSLDFSGLFGSPGSGVPNPSGQMFFETFLGDTQKGV